MGRVWLDQVEGATLFIIPAKKDWKILFFLAWLTIWLIGPYSVVVRAVHSLAHPATADWFNVLWGIGWLFGIWFAGSMIIWSLGGVEQLRLSAAEAELIRSVFGIVFRRRTMPTSQIRNLRYTPAGSAGPRKYRPSCISFEGSKGTVKFGSDLEDAEALATIEQMLAVYPFPKKDRALAYLDLSS